MILLSKKIKANKAFPRFIFRLLSFWQEKDFLLFYMRKQLDLRRVGFEEGDIVNVEVEIKEDLLKEKHFFPFFPKMNMLGN